MHAVLLTTEVLEGNGNKQSHASSGNGKLPFYPHAIGQGKSHA
jgi:hypothetical protein